MHELDNTIYESLNRYFKTLSQFGYINDKKLTELITLIFFNQALYEFQGYITEQDYKNMDRILTCFQLTNCLIPYDKYLLAVQESPTYLFDTPTRITEYNEVRIAQHGAVRIVNQ